MEAVKSTEIFPAEIVIREKEPFARADRKIRKAYKNLPARMEQLLGIYMDELSNLQHLENYMDYFYGKPEHIWDYMNSDRKIAVDDPNSSWENMEAVSKEFSADFEVFMEKGRVVSSDYFHFPSTRDLEMLYGSADIWLRPVCQNIKGVAQLDHMETVHSRQTLSYNGKLDILEKELERYLKDGYKAAIVCSSEERLKNIEEFLTRCGLRQNVAARFGYLFRHEFTG